MNIEQGVSAKLQELYNIPFEAKSSGTYYSPIYNIKPANSSKDLFDLTIIIKDNVRLIMEFQPEKYSANLIHDMGNASIEKKSVFCAYANMLMKKKSKVQLKINDKNAICNDYKDWDTDWRHLDIRVTRIADEDEDYLHNQQNLVDWASLMMGMILSLVNIEIDSLEYAESEGNCQKILANKYERSRVNRVLCLEAHGCRCAVCDMNFEEEYGDIGKGFIHVHHKIPVSAMGSDYLVDPINDLVPVCPNCHYMLHRKNPPITIEELKEMLT